MRLTVLRGLYGTNQIHRDRATIFFPHPTSSKATGWAWVSKLVDAAGGQNHGDGPFCKLP